MRAALRPLRRVAQKRTYLATRGPGFLGCLGGGDWNDRDALVPVEDDNDNKVNVTSVAAGWAHSAAVLEDGVAVVWGRYLEPPESALRLSHIHRAGAFGRGLTRVVNATALWMDRDGSLRLRPTPVTDHASMIACGAGVTAIVKTNGDLECFGANAFGQCGVGDHSDVVREPSAVKWDTAQKAVKSIALGFRHGICLSADGLVHAWGKNDAGQLGDGLRNSRPSVMKVMEEECSGIGAGLNHSACLTKGGRLFVWGKMRDASSSKPSEVSRDLPDLYGDALVPRPVPGRKYVDVACSSFHCVVLDEQGAVFCMGLERGSREMVHAPRPVRLPSGVKAVAIKGGVDAVAILASDNLVYAPDLAPGLACGSVVRETAAVVDVALGWKHAVAVAA